MKGIERVTAFEQQLAKIPHHKRRGFVDSFYAGLLRGEIYDLGGEGIEAAAELLKSNGFQDHAHKLFLHYNSVVRKDPVKDYEYLKARMPEYFAERVERGAILSRNEMQRLSTGTIDDVFERLFDHVTAYGLDILPEYSNAAMLKLEQELLQTMSSLKEVLEDDLPSLRKKIGNKPELIELRQVGDTFYTQTKRKKNAAMQTGELEFRVGEAVPVQGPRFFATKVCGYHGILRYFLVEVDQVAPDSANAYLDGTGILRTVTCRGMWSPIVAGNLLRPIPQEDGEYHIVPVKFFTVCVDQTQKFKGEWNAVKGKKDTFRFVVKPRQ